jgi:hypothetical protein
MVPAPFVIKSLTTDGQRLDSRITNHYLSSSQAFCALKCNHYLISSYFFLDEKVSKKSRLLG